MKRLFHSVYSLSQLVNIDDSIYLPIIKYSSTSIC
jgi:hypothetical protein